MKARKGVIPVFLLAVLALVIAAGGVGIGLAWKTDVLDKILPPNIKEFFGKEITPTNGEPPAGDQEQPTGEETQPTTEDATKDWKTFEDTKSGYRIKYPSSWFSYQNAFTYRLEEFGASVFSSAPVLDSVAVPVGEVAVDVGLLGADKKDSESLMEYLKRILLADEITDPSFDFGGRVWVKTVAEDKSVALYTFEGNKVYTFGYRGGHVEGELYPLQVTTEQLQIVELVVSTLEVL